MSAGSRDMLADVLERHGSRAESDEEDSIGATGRQGRNYLVSWNEQDYARI